MGLIPWVRRRLFFLWVTLSMVLCAILFFPWFLPRETVCGLMGRWQSTARGARGWVGDAGARFFNSVLHTDPDEGCNAIWQMEEAARRELYRPEELG